MSNLVRATAQYPFTIAVNLMEGYFVVNSMLILHMLSEGSKNFITSNILYKSMVIILLLSQQQCNTIIFAKTMQIMLRERHYETSRF